MNLVMTCDKCGKLESFDLSLVSPYGPIVLIRDPRAVMERAGWQCVRDGLRSVDICKKCRADRENPS